MLRSRVRCSAAAIRIQQKRWKLTVTLSTILFAVLTFTGFLRQLHACSPWPAVIQISPRLGVEAPQNTTVLLYFPLQWQVRYLSPNGELRPMYEVMVALRAIGSVQPVETHRSDTQQGIDTVVELRPQQLLQPGEYELSVKVAEQETVVGQFSVGAVIDRAAPGFRTRPRARFDQDYRSLFEKADVTVCDISGPEGDCDVGGLAIMFDRTDAKDNHTPASAIRLAVWANPEPGPIDYSRAPTEYLFARVVQLPFLALDIRHLWGSKKCEEMPLAWRQPTAIRIGVRPIDLAGNLGAAWETVVTDRDVWKPPPANHRGDRIVAPLDIQPATRRKDTVARMAPFAKAVARSITLHRWLLAADECVLASHFIGSMPESCREVSRQHEVNLRLPYGFPE